jgi:hypothetical protein
MFKAIADSEGASPVHAMDTVPVVTMDRLASFFERIKKLGPEEVSE